MKGYFIYFGKEEERILEFAFTKLFSSLHMFIEQGFDEISIDVVLDIYEGIMRSLGCYIFE